MLALVGRPSLHGYYACLFIGLMAHFGEVAGKNNVRPLFLPYGFFCLVGILGKGFGVFILCYFWIGRARHPGPTSLPPTCWC